MASTSLYDTLSPERADIRLLTIEAAESFSAPLKTTLKTQNLEEAPVAFEALSYCWGIDDSREEITINGLQSHIRKNLLDALKRLRRQNEDRTIWVDAICINQDSVSEKNHQVPYMPIIYTQADQVIAWLGEEDDDTSLAFDLIRKWAYMYYNHTYESEFINALTPESCKSFIDLVGRPFWERIWVVQEVILSKQAILKCGPHQVSFMQLRQALGAMQAIRDGDVLNLPVAQHNMTLDMYTWAPTKMAVMYDWMCEEESWQFSAPNLLTMTAYMQCSDPKDKIYALLGLTNVGPDAKVCQIVPKYHLSVAEVYEDVVTSRVEATKDLQMIAMAGYGTHFSRSLPSWVPCLDDRVRPVYYQSGLRGPREVYLYDRLDAAKGTLADCSFSKGSHKFKTRGIVCDKLSWEVDFDGPMNDRESAISHVRDLFWSLKKHGALNRPNPDGFPQLQMLFRTIILDDAKSNSAEREPMSFPTNDKFFEMAIAFLYILADLYEADNASTVPELPSTFINEHSDACFNRQRLALMAEFSGRKDFPRRLEWTFGGENSPYWADWDASKMHLRLGYLFRYLTNLGSLRFFFTEQGYTGLGPQVDLRKGDRICILAGCRVPLVVRKVRWHYILLGDCYCFGMTHGEAVTKAEQGRLQWQSMKFE